MKRETTKALKTLRKSTGNKLGLVILATVIAVSLAFTLLDKWGGIYDTLGLSGAGLNNAFGGQRSGEGVSVHFIDVGQGDCALIITPENSVLIDSGERDYYSTVVNYIRARGVGKLDYIIATHPHSDHIGGIGNIIDELGADMIIMPEIPEELTPTTSGYIRMLDSIYNNSVEAIYAKPGMKFDLGNSQMEIIAPVGNYDNLNDYSVVMRFTYENHSFLFTGDIEAAVESDIVDSGDITAEVLSVSHHGSRTSSTAKFLNAVGGNYAVISVGSPNSYNHPDDRVLNRLLDRNYEILRTDLHGNIVFDCGGEALEVYVQKGGQAA